MQSNNPAIRRCAVYTRKSSEEGLEQDFNSLHAQREACEAFVKSQAGEGWRLLKAHYDDGGVSGGTMERPALQRLLEEIGNGHVDVVVVYKVDRLTRSLADFAKMVEIFDAHGVSFVAVTQQFNTTTSMGRLTLNVLLSFAQFEREVTGERIRDKIAASKKKGMWMGGTTPLGYDVDERKLVVNLAEAETVREICRRYLELGSVRLLQQELHRRGVMSKIRISKSGIRSGGQPFSRGALYELLSNPIYIGEIRHKKTRHPGQHEPIVERELWERVQERLRDAAVRSPEPRTKAPVSPLAGKLFDEEGEPLYAQGAAKGGRRYRYYVSRKLVRGSAAENEGGWRLAAPELERSVAVALRLMLTDHAAIAEALERAALSIEQIAAVFRAAEAAAQALASDDETPPSAFALVNRIGLRRDGMEISLDLAGLMSFGSGAPLTLNRFVPLEIRRRGVELRLVMGGEAAVAPRCDPALLKAAARGFRWFNELISGRVRSAAEIARREGLRKQYIGRFLALAFLAPSLVEAIAQGVQPAELNIEALTRIDLPLDWTVQQQTFGIA
jgi:site-specific DNA recombinase